MTAIIVFMSDNGPSRETRNWLDGTTDPYYGGSAGSLKGHKYSLYEGGDSCSRYYLVGERGFRVVR